METRQIHTRDLSTVTGIQQFEHAVQSIYFLGLEDFEGNIYISIESDDYSNEAIPLTNNTFIIGQPMTLYNTTYICQIYGVLNNGEKIQLSKRFRLIIDKSNNIQGDSEEYPIDPNFTNGIIEFMNEQKEQAQSEIEATGDAVIESIPSDYTALNRRVGDLESTFSDLTGLEKNLADTWIENSYVKTDGTFANYDGWKRTDFIEIPDNVKSLIFYTDMNDPSQSGYNVYYDSDKNKVTNFRFENNGVSNMVDSIKYVVFSLPSRYTLLVKPNVKSVFDAVYTLENLNKHFYKIPSYYATHVANKINEVNTKMRANYYRDAFIFFSDPHFPSNNLASSDIIKAIQWNTNVKTVICGGDLVTMIGDQTTIDDAVLEFLNKYERSIDDFYILHGNHDYTIVPSVSESNEGFTLPPEYVYDVMFRYLENSNVQIEENNRFYYFDHTTSKIRFIALDTSDFFLGESGPFNYKGVTPQQAEWFRDVLTNTPNDMDFIVMTHIGINTNITSYSQAGVDSFGRLVEALNKRESGSFVNNGVTITYDFTNATNKVLMCINGHGHRDQTYLSDTTLYYSIGADYPSTDDPNVSRTSNTVTDNIVDVIMIRNDGVVETVRFGAGESKEITLPNG